MSTAASRAATLLADLLEVAHTGDYERLDALLLAGAPVDGQHAINGWTALHWAAKRGNRQVVERLLAASADQTIRNNKGETAVQVAADSVRPLLSGGQDVVPAPDPVKEAGFTPSYLQHPEFFYAQDQSDIIPAGKAAPQGPPATVPQHPRDGPDPKFAPVLAAAPPPAARTAVSDAPARDIGPVLAALERVERQLEHQSAAMPPAYITLEVISPTDSLVARYCNVLPTTLVKDIVAELLPIVDHRIWLCSTKERTARLLSCQPIGAYCQGGEADKQGVYTRQVYLASASGAASV